MLYNFAKASMTKDEAAQKMADVQADVMRLLNEGGVSAVDAETKWRAGAAALIREVIIDTFKMTDPTPIFTDRRDGTMGDHYEFERLINTLRVVEYSPQSEPQIFTPRKGKHAITTSAFELAYGIPLQKILNRQHTIGEFANMAAEAIRRHYVSLVLNAIDLSTKGGAVDLKGRALRTAAAGADVSKDELDAALRRMVAFNEGVTIFGTRWALDPIFDIAAQAAYTIAEDLNQRGVIGVYRGAKLVELTDDENLFYQKWTQVNGVDMDKLLFIASGVKGATLMERNLSALNWQDMNVEKAQWRSGVRFDHGILVHSPYRYHVIEMA